MQKAIRSIDNRVSYGYISPSVPGAVIKVLVQDGVFSRPLLLSTTAAASFMYDIYHTGKKP
ncbi:MAG TPA: hypothetical protein VL197_00660 [Nitrospirota bacterium]|nr:hypothetical protein [Nitrospirota bacterium]